MPLPPRCRAARSRPPDSGAAGYISVNFKKKIVKNEIEKYKNKKTASIQPMISQPTYILHESPVVSARSYTKTQQHSS